MRWALLAATLCVWAGGCSESASTTSNASTMGEPIAGSGGASDLAMQPPAPGYQRFVPEPIEVAAGESNDWAQWVGGPLDKDYDVVDITGTQSRGGHHALLYATNEAQPAGFTRLWHDADQLTTRLMGGVGGEGGAKVVLPPGIVFRVKKGSHLLMQTHYLNTSETPIIGTTVLDVKLIPADPSHRLASIMANTTTGVDLAPGLDSTLDVTCQVQQDLQFIQVANHMHEHGTSMLTEFVDPSGQTHELKSDPQWSYEWALNPNFASFPVEEPLLVPAGSMMKSRCTWNNMTDRPITFPAEMCVFFGFILNDSDIYCDSGRWSTARDGSGSAVGGPGAGAAASDGGVAEAGACLNDADRAIMDGAAFEQDSTDCATPCALDPNVAECTASCLVEDVGLSPACAACNGSNVACGARECLVECVADSASEPCRTCVEANCAAEYHRCTGI
jgi:Copper type II ascorbate-dependent monooxygenase, C-terminal domain